MYKQFLDWLKLRVFAGLWRAGLAECDDLERIAQTDIIAFRKLKLTVNKIYG
jgi:hypothetical protein